MKPLLSQVRCAAPRLSKPSALIMLLAGLGLAIPVSAQKAGTAAVTGHVTAVHQMDLLSAQARGGAVVQVQRESRGTLLVTIAGIAAPAHQTGEVIDLQLALRTNAPTFQLSAERMHTVAELEIGAALHGLSGTGSQLAPDAAANFRASEDTKFGDAAVLATGTRISARGSFSSPENALLARIRVKVPGAFETVAFRVRMGS